MASSGIFTFILVMAVAYTHNFDRIGTHPNIGVNFEKQPLEVQMFADTFQLAYNIKLPKLHTLLPLIPVESPCSTEYVTFNVESPGRNRQVQKPGPTLSRCQLLYTELLSLRDQVNLDVLRVNALEKDLEVIMDELRYTSRDA